MSIIRILLIILVLFPSLSPALKLSDWPSKHGFLNISVVSKRNFPKFALSNRQFVKVSKKFCKHIKQLFKRYRIAGEPCSVPWQAKLRSRHGWPLLYASFGSGKNVSLFLGGVHPDELTPVFLAFRWAEYLAKHPEIYKPGSDRRLIVAPLVSPDGFLRKNHLRTNGHLVDVNRNFFTPDWHDNSWNLWVKKGGRLRYFPGILPNSEPETLFQLAMIDEFQPDKIGSFHAPLGFLDYDGPHDPVSRGGIEGEMLFVKQLAGKIENFPVVNYPFFTGSLGNHIGKEGQIPTVTWELTSSNPKHMQKLWTSSLSALLEFSKYLFKRPGPFDPHNKLHFFRSYINEVY